MRRSGMLAALAALTALTAPAGLLPATPAAAYPLDEVLQQVYLTPTATTLEIEIDITAGSLVAADFARSLDTDGNRRLSASEKADHDVRLKTALTLTVDETLVEPMVTDADYPGFALLEAGGGVVTLRATAPLDAAAKRFALTDNYPSDQKTRVQMSVLVARDAGRVAGDVERGADGRAITASLTPGDAATTAAGRSDEGTGETMLHALRDPLGSTWVPTLLIALCALLGAMHALTPGHGKAMLAGSLVGARGTVRHAVALGAVLTATRTGPVLLLGGAVLAAGHYLVPDLLVPALRILTGLAVLVLGVRITLRRWRGLRSAGSRHDHRTDRWEPAGAPDDHEDDDADEEYHVDPGPARGHRGPAGHAWPYDRGAVLIAEREVIPQSAASRRRELAAMGAGGGLIPGPEALGVLILAAGLNRAGPGFAMIVAFGAGLAAVLVGFGLILVSARDRFAGMRPGPLLARLPVVSAAVVLGLGLVVTVSGVLAAIGP